MTVEKAHEWFGGSVPDGWSIVRLGSVFRERSEQTTAEDLAPLSVTKNGVVKQQDSVAVSAIGAPKKIVRRGDFVINSRSDRKGSAGIAPREGSVSLINIVLEPVGIEPEYARFLLTSYGFQEEFYRFGSGIVADLWTTRYSAMKSIKIPLPPRKVQLEIVENLERELNEANQLIANNERLQVLLEEKLNASVEREMWNQDFNLIPIKHLASILPGFAFKSAVFSVDASQIPLLRGINVGVGNLKWDETVYVDRSVASEHKLYRLKKNDLVLGLDRPVIGAGTRVAKVAKSNEGTLLVQRVARIRANSEIVSEDWILLALNSTRFKAYLEPISTGVSVPHMSPEQLGNFKIPVPETLKQEAILTQIESLKKFLQSISKSPNASHLFSEKKAATIKRALHHGTHSNQP